MWKWIDSVTMNRYNLNIPINSSMLLSTCESTQSSQRNDSNDSIKSINQLNIYVDLYETSSISLPVSKNVQFRWPFWKRSISLTFLGNLRVRWPFWDILNQFNWFNHTVPSKSIDSIAYFMKTNWLSHQSTYLETELNWFNQFCGKNELIHVNQLSRVDWYTSLLSSRGTQIYLLTA